MTKFKMDLTNATEATGEITPADFNAALESIFQTGARADILHLSESGLDYMWRRRYITRREYLWLKSRFLVGHLKRSVRSFVRSVLRITGTVPTE